MNTAIIPIGAFEANAVLLWEDPACAWLVDPGTGAASLLAEIKRHGLTLGVVVLTHGHIDHISAVDGIVAAYPVPVYMHPDDAEWAFTPANRLAPYLRVPARPATLRSDFTDGHALSVGGIDARLLHTPGHSPGCICIHIPSARVLVSGDTLFAGSIGRTDFRGGDAAVMQRSLARLTSLPPETVVIPGHGPNTTIGEEIRSNPFLA